MTKFFIFGWLKEHKISILKGILIVLGCALVLLFSGSSYITFGASSNTKIILYIVAFIYFLVIVVSNIRIGFFTSVRDKKRIPVPSYLTFAIFTTLFFVLLSFLFNPKKAENINTYFSIILTLSIAYFILVSFKPRFILNCFKNTMLIITTIDIVIFAFTFFSKTFFPTFYYATERSIFGNHSFFSADLVTSFTLNYHGLYRLYGVLWEPSIFGVVLVAALICDVFSKDKYSVIRIIVFTLGVVLTFSLSAFILYAFYVVIFIAHKLKGYKPYYFVIAFFLLVLVFAIFSKQIMNFLADKLPSIFSKIGSDDKSTSFSTRMYSIWYYLLVFAKNPIFGFGGVTATEMYHEIRSAAVTADTSTFGNLLASYGIGGVVYIASLFAGVILTKKMSAPLKIVLCTAIFVSSNAQGQGAVLGLTILYFLPLATVEKPSKAVAFNERFYEGSSDKTLKDFVLQKNDDGTVSSNILMSLVLKGVSLILAFVTIPAYLKYFNSDESTYGIWLAITSILSVITIFDFGMGNGLKNKLIKNIYNKDDSNSKTIISTTYLITLSLGVVIAIAGILTIFLLPESTIAMVFFKGKETTANNITMFRIGFSIIMIAIGLQFCLKNINYILQAHQRNAITGIFMLITNASLLLFVLIFANKLPADSKILYLAIAYFAFLILPLLIANLILFFGKYKTISPSAKSIDFRESKDVVKTSMKFFLVQLGTLFLWSLNEWILLFSFDFNAAYITEYNEYYKLFSLLPIMLGTIIQQPIWTALSKADVEHNKKSIKKYIIVLALVAVAFLAFNLILSLCLQFVFNLWLGSSAPSVSTMKVLSFVSYSVIYIVALAMLIICNAFSLFKSQIATALLAIFVKIPLLILFLTYTNISWEIVIFINAFCYLPIFIGAPIEIMMYLKKSNNEKGDINNEKVSA